MRKIKMLVFSLSIALFLAGCQSTVTNEDVFQFKDSYVGDNSAVINITNQLRSSEQLEGFELKTKEEPYGIIINYDLSESVQVAEETVIYNATFLFALVKIVDWITFNFGNDYEYTVTKDQLQNWHGEDLHEFTNEEELKSFIQEQLEDEANVQQFFDALS